MQIVFYTFYKTIKNVVLLTKQQHLLSCFLKIFLVSISKEFTNVSLFFLLIQDDQHLDFVIKLNGTVSDDEEYFGIFYNWKDESGADAQAFTNFHYIDKERRFYFEVHIFEY